MCVFFFLEKEINEFIAMVVGEEALYDVKYICNINTMSIFDKSITMVQKIKHITTLF